MSLPEHERTQAVKRVLYLVLATNGFLALGKIGYGYETHTLGLVADGFHSLLDMAASVLGLLGVTLAAAPPDAEHQYGHRKFEILSAMAIGMFIFAGAGVVLHEAYERLREPQEHEPVITWASFAVAGLSISTGLALSFYEAQRAKVLASPILDSDAAHTWSDVTGSIAVLVGLVLTRFVNPLADAIVALGLGLYLVKVGYSILMRGLGVISDRAVLDPADVERVAREFGHVQGTARIRTRGEDHHFFLDMVLLVDPTLTVADAHALVDRFEERLKAAFPGCQDIVIHVEPGTAVVDAGAKTG
jgi:cation diffusion facilitator family transporter